MAVENIKIFNANVFAENNFFKEILGLTGFYRFFLFQNIHRKAL